MATIAKIRADIETLIGQLEGEIESLEILNEEYDEDTDSEIYNRKCDIKFLKKALTDIASVGAAGFED